MEQAAPDDEPLAANQLDDDDKADGQTLWGGLTSLTIERYSSDPCANGAHALPDAFTYEEYARTRATVRNVCFEVWSPGVTDWDNPDFWQQLDVRVYYRWGHEGDWASDYVTSIDRRGNNRRYAWALDWRLDSFIGRGTVPAVSAPLRILSETASHAYVEKDVEFYFTINGRKLDNSQNKPFVIHYQGYVGKPALTAKPEGHVLYEQVTCANGGMKIGGGAGYIAVDIRDPQAIAALGGGLDGSELYAIPVGQTATQDILSMTFSSQQDVWGQTLPQYGYGFGGSIVPEFDAMTVWLATYVRADDLNVKRSYRFTGCARVP